MPALDADPEAGLPAGLLIDGRYELLRELGRGGMGRVFAGRDRKLGRDVAIKMIRSEMSSSTAVRRFEQEARAAGGLNHPGVLVVHDIGQHQGRPFLVTELLAGETLRQRLAAGPMPVAETLRLAVQIAEGLAAAHRKGIVHRDLKPENIFLTDGGRAKILDFGIAKLVEVEPGGTLSEAGDGNASSALTGPDRVVGTMGYMPPEQLRGQPVDHRADIFSFGAVLYEMLSSARAFHAPTAVETGYAVLTKEPPPLPPQVPREFGLLVERCLRKQADDRPSSAVEIQQALASQINTPTTTILPSQHQPITRGAIAVALAAAALAGLTATLLLRRSVRVSPPVNGGGLVAVFPFDTREAPGYAYLGEGFIDLLHARMQSGPVRPLDSRSVVHSAQGSAPADATMARALAAKLGARLLVVGAVAAHGDRVRVRASLFATNSARALREAVAEGTLKETWSMVDTLAGQLGLSEAALGIGRSTRPAKEMTQSPPALKAFLEGEAAARRNEFPATIQAFSRAVAADGEFALAHYRLAVVAAVTEPGLSADSLRRALRFSERLPLRDRRRLEAFAAAQEARPDEAERLYRTFLRDQPDDVQGWFELGELLFHLNPPRGRPASDAQAAFERAALLDPGHGSALAHLVDLAVLYRQQALTLTFADRFLAVAADEDEDTTLGVRWAQAWAAADAAAKSAVFARLEVSDNLRAYASVFARALRQGSDLADAFRVANLAERSERTEVRRLGLSEHAVLDLVSGRPAAARQRFQQAAELDRAGATRLWAISMETLDYVPVTPERLQKAREEIEKVPVTGAAEFPALRAHLGGLLALRAGDVAAAEGFAKTLESMAPVGPTSITTDLARSLRARVLLRHGRKNDALAELGKLELRITFPYAVTVPQLSEQLLRAGLQRERGQAREALSSCDAVAPVGLMDSTRLVELHLCRARALESSDRPRAAEEYAFLLRLWAEPEPELLPLVSQVKASLQKLQ